MRKPQQAATRPGTNSLWQKLAGREDAAPFIELDPLYALNPQLIDTIVKFVPKLLSPQDIAFERALCQATSGGFWRQSPFDYPVLDAPPDERIDQLNRQIREMLVDEMKTAGLTKTQIERRLNQVKKYLETSALLVDEMKHVGH